MRTLLSTDRCLLLALYLCIYILLLLLQDLARLMIRAADDSNNAAIATTTSAAIVAAPAAVLLRSDFESLLHQCRKRKWPHQVAAVLTAMHTAAAGGSLDAGTVVYVYTL
jgi:hypothetical protein